MRRMAGRVAVLAALVVASGCATAAKQAISTIRGPQGNFLLEEARPPSAFAAYRVVVVEPFQNRIPRHISASLVRASQAKTVEELTEAGYFDKVLGGEGESAAGTLVIRGKLLDIKSDSIPGQRLISGANHLIAHVQLVDGASGEVLAWAVVRGVVKSVVHSEEGDLAEGLAKGVRKFVKKVVGVEDEE